MPRALPAALAVLALLGASAEAWARIKLITLPVRQRVDIQLEYPRLTLVQEERVVPLVKGINQVDFSWTNAHIDPGSVVLRIAEAAGGGGAGARVLSVSYPPGENALVWSVAAEASGPALVRIGYMLGGISRHFHYRAVAGPDERHLRLAQYLRIENRAREGFPDAYLWAGDGDPVQRSLGADETKEVLIEGYTRVRIRKAYTADPVRQGYLAPARKQLKVPLYYVIENDPASGLGAGALPFGKARIFQRDGRGGTAFLGEDWAQRTPPGEELRLFLGLARDIVVKRTVGRNEATRVDGNLYRYELVLRYEIESFKDEPVTLDLIEDVRALRQEVGRASPLDPQWRLGGQTTVGEPDPEESDYQRLVFHVELPPRGPTGKARRLVHRLHLWLENEWRAP